MPTFRVGFGANDLNCVDVPLHPTHSLTQFVELMCSQSSMKWSVYSPMINLADAEKTILFLGPD